MTIDIDGNNVGKTLKRMESIIKIETSKCKQENVEVVIIGCQFFNLKVVLAIYEPCEGGTDST